MIRLLLLAAAIVLAQPSQRAPVPATVDDLMRSVTAVRRDSSFRILAVLTRTRRGTDAPAVRHLTIMGRRTAGGTTLRIVQTWPEVRGGAAYVVDSTGSVLSGFLLNGTTVTKLGAADGVRPLFDSDVTLEDVAEKYLYWPGRSDVGEEPVREYRCRIVDLRPGPGAPTAYSRVRVWIAPVLRLALRAEEYGVDGRLLKRVTLFRELQIEDRWVPGIVTVERADGGSRTVLEGTKYDPLPPLPSGAFSVEGVRKAVSGGS